ncbi:MAG: YkvA family protein [Actinomycetota bacterium]
MRVFWITLASVAAVWVIAVAVLYALGRRTQARALVTLIPNLLVLFKGLLRDPRVSRGSKAWLWLAVIWLVSPIDLIPEFIPVLGPLDDAVVAALVLRHVLRTTDGGVLAEHWRGDPATLEAITRLGSRDRVPRGVP